MSASASMASIAPGANATTTSAKRTLAGQHDHRDENGGDEIGDTERAEPGIDVADERRLADPRKARADHGCRCRPAPRRASRAAGHPRSARCRAARRKRSSRRTSSSPEIWPAEAAARRRRQRPPARRVRGRGDQARHLHRRRGRNAGQRQQQRQRRGQDDHPHGLHHGDRGDVGAFLGGKHGDLRQRAGAAGGSAEVWSQPCTRCR